MDAVFDGFILPPGRSSVFAGIKNTTIIDSTYNATSEGVKAMIDAFSSYPGNDKWLVLGDMLEQGANEKLEHEKLADIIKSSGAKNVVLVGPRLKVYTYPLLMESFDADHIVCFEMPAPAIQYIETRVKGGEIILFKGARFLEGVVEALLLNKEDAKKLCRREAVWVKRRHKWGLQ
jgi:UDP-N-acetylmuramoyl-tripeptide--D-alanyl-D-alanine ligase